MSLSQALNQFAQNLGRYLKTDNFTLLSWSKLHDTKYDALLKSKIWKRGTVTRVNGNASVLYRSKLID